MARNQSSEFRRSHEKTRILVKDYSKDFYLDFEPVRRSIINSSPKARYSSAFSVEIFVKDYIFSCLSARNLWRKSLIKIWPMARNQSSEFRRSHEKTRILVKDYSKDFYLDFEPVRRSIINSSPKARYSSAFSVEIFVKDYIFSCLSARCFGVAKTE